MADIFSRQVSFGNAFKSEDVQISFSGISVGMLVQNLSLGYQQQISRLWELGSQRQYYIAGRSGGNFSMAKLSGPSGGTQAFVSKYGDVCNAQSNTVQFNYGGGWCKGGTTGGLKLHHVVVESVGMNISSADMIVNEAVSGMYASASNA